MATEALKSTAITNLDATPPVRTTDLGMRVQHAFATVTGTTGVTSGSTYQLFRLPSNAKLESLELWLDAAVTTFAGDVTLYYSDNALDGSVSKAGTGQVAAHVYSTALDLHATTAPKEVYRGGNITAAGLGKELWQDAGLSADPKVFFDVVIVTTSTTSGAPVVAAHAAWIAR